MDFDIPLNGFLIVFGADRDLEQCIYIPIMDDPDEESIERFTVALSIAENTPVTLVSPVMAVVAIIDNG